MRKILSAFLPLILFLFSSASAQQRIVSLNGAISEMLCALDLEPQIVGVDVASTYPASLKKKTSVGHNRTLSAESILALRPSLVLAVETDVKPEVLEQLRSAKVNIVLVQQAYSADGTRKLLQDVAKATNTTDKGNKVLATFNKEMAALKVAATGKKVLFVYARGTGSMTVCGVEQSPNSMIRLAGASNAMTEFKGFKPLTTESLVAANPDVILLFESGLQSVGGAEGLLKVPGISSTNAGKNKKIISMDGQFLAGFGLRLPQAIATLNKKISG
ncbi:ABC transporter substrate-binding protein [Pseudoflavitalea sp. G-6-1-2]|uniref:ABC transporter substrate-binding protein n=1 Tax=Pseudoflavitalea sp. G-6-1-2 TaxID=2728841 RepID=UPI00197F6B20